MQLETLELALGDTLVGHVYRYAGFTKLLFADSYINNPQRPQLSVAFSRPRDEAGMRELLGQQTLADRSGAHGCLPVFLSNALPEGALRDRIAALAGTHRDDELSLLAACAQDLPGALRARPVNAPSAALMQRLVTQNNDALEPSVVAASVPGAVSLSGIQPKLQLSKDRAGRYTFIAKRGRQHFIGKLPAPSYGGLPEVEYASMQLARAAGVHTADCELVPMVSITGNIELHHGIGSHFLSVKRFDRDASARHSGHTLGGRLHMEDFCQVLGIAANAKYDGSALQIMTVLAGLGRHTDVEELVRRWVVNELLGNFDAHLKNYSLLYTAPQSPVLSPAYDIVAYSVFINGKGAALRWLPSQRSPTPLTKAVLKALLEHTQSILQNAKLHTPLTLQRLTKIATQTQNQALDTWPALLPNLPLSASQVARLTERFGKMREQSLRFK